MTTNEIDYEFIKQWLKRGELKELAKKYGIHKNSATRILKGDFKNYDFVQIVYKVALERAQSFLTLHEKLRELSEQTKGL